MILFTLVAIKWALVYLRGRVIPPSVETFAEPVRIEPVAAISVAKTEQAAQAVAASSVPRKAASVKVSENTIDCGACGKEITSACVEIQHGRSPKDAQKIFECEHCGTRVAIPAN